MRILRRFRFSLRSLFVITLVISLALSGVRMAVPWDECRQDQRLRAELQLIGASYQTEYYVPAWAAAIQNYLPIIGRELVPYEAFRRVEAILMSADDISPSWFKHLQDGDKIRTLIIFCPAFSDESLEYLCDLSELDYLDLTGTSISDDGIPELLKQKRLRYLVVAATALSDEGLASLCKGLPNTDVSTLDVEYSFGSDPY